MILINLFYKVLYPTITLKLESQNLSPNSKDAKLELIEKMQS